MLKPNVYWEPTAEIIRKGVYSCLLASILQDGMGELSELIRKTMDHDGRTRYELAKRSGLSQSALSRFASGERGLSLDAVEKLMSVLGLVVVKSKKPAKETAGKVR